MALGINCRGSIFCQYGPSSSSPDIISTFVALATSNAGICPSTFSCGPIADSDSYAPGAPILCYPQGAIFRDGICAFTQGNVSTDGTRGLIIRKKLAELRRHGCTLCGSVPLSAMGNDPSEEGELTVNYVRNRVSTMRSQRQPHGKFYKVISKSEAIQDGAAPATCLPKCVRGHMVMVLNWAEHWDWVNAVTASIILHMMGLPRNSEMINRHTGDIQRGINLTIHRLPTHLPLEKEPTQRNPAATL
ncbi:MAG: hypothetical protein Q9172_003200 [Xanthocarpia lactea]